MPIDDTFTTFAGIAVLNLAAAAALMLGVGPGYPNGYGWRHAVAGLSRRTLRLFANALRTARGSARKLAGRFRRQAGAQRRQRVQLAPDERLASRLHARD